MKFNFDLQTIAEEEGRSATPKDEVEWVPLQKHPVFTSTTTDPVHQSEPAPAPRNLLAWDGASRLYFWDSNKRCLHRISVRLGDPDPTSVLAASPSKVLQADVKVNFVVHKISINRNGSALLLSSSDGLCIMYLYGRTSTKDNATICRTVTVGSQIYLSGSNVIRILQVSWHPNSDTHLGILSFDSVFRIFDLSSDLMKPEQEYYLQPVQPGRSRNAPSIFPVDFSFGGDHLWDWFSVFVLFSDGSVYILCPIIPFGSVYKWESIVEIYNDAQTFGLKSANSVAVRNSNLAISWLEATFPEISDQATGADLSVIRAHPNALFDASLSLQGPLRKVCSSDDEDLALWGTECEGRAVSFLYNLVSKDSVLVTAWSGGQLQIDALTDEIQPVWNVGSPPRLRFDSRNQILGLAMICESTPGKLSSVKFDQPLDSTLWLGHSPPLLRLAIVDLALPRNSESGYLIMMFTDPLVPEIIYTLHGGGIDSIVLHYLPFTSQSSGKNETMRTPSVHLVLSTCQGEISSQSPLSGFVSLSDSFGYSWIVGVTVARECLVLEMKTWNLLLPLHVNMEDKNILREEPEEKDIPEILSKELLSGPKVGFLPQISPNLHYVTADSIDGRSMLHRYLKLFHENYVEYAHKVYFEIKHHGPRLKRIIDDQHACLGDAQQKLLKVEDKQSKLDDRIDCAMQLHKRLEERLKRLRNLLGDHIKPLSRAEREFKSELGHFSRVELDALRSSIDTLSARMRKHTQSPKGNVSNQQRMISRRNDHVHDSQISQLKSLLKKFMEEVNRMRVEAGEALANTRDEPEEVEVQQELKGEDQPTEDEDVRTAETVILEEDVRDTFSPVRQIILSDCEEEAGEEGGASQKKEEMAEKDLFGHSLPETVEEDSQKAISLAVLATVLIQADGPQPAISSKEEEVRDETVLESSSIAPLFEEEVVVEEEATTDKPMNLSSATPSRGKAPIELEPSSFPSMATPSSEGSVLAVKASSYTLPASPLPDFDPEVNQCLDLFSAVTTTIIRSVDEYKPRKAKAPTNEMGWNAWRVVAEAIVQGYPELISEKAYARFLSALDSLLADNVFTPLEMTQINQWKNMVVANRATALEADRRWQKGKALSQYLADMQRELLSRRGEVDAEKKALKEAKARRASLYTELIKVHAQFLEADTEVMRRVEALKQQAAPAREFQVLQQQLQSFEAAQPEVYSTLMSASGSWEALSGLLRTHMGIYSPPVRTTRVKEECREEQRHREA